MTDTATMMKPTPKVRPLTHPVMSMIDDDDLQMCPCCQRIYAPKGHTHCVNCAAHHAELLDALRRARAYVEREFDDYSELTWDDERGDVDAFATSVMLDAEELLKKIDELLGDAGSEEGGE